MRLLGQFILFFFMKIFHTHKKPTKHPSNVYSNSYTPKSIIKHTGDFHLDITPKSIKKQVTFYPDISLRLKKMHKNSGS